MLILVLQMRRTTIRMNITSERQFCNRQNRQMMLRYHHNFLKNLARTAQERRVLTQRPSHSSRNDQTLSFCVDYRDLNEVTVFDPHLIPRIDCILNKISRAKFIGKLDLTNG